MRPVCPGEWCKGHPSTLQLAIMNSPSRSGPLQASPLQIDTRMAHFYVSRLWLLGWLLLAGCATFTPQPVPDVLARADRALSEQRYPEAQGLYREFHRRFPEHPAAGRAQAAADVLEQLATLQAGDDALRRDVVSRDATVQELQSRLDHLQDELRIVADWRAEERDLNGKAQRELTTVRAEVRRLRTELRARDVDIERLAGDLQRLRSVDLRPAAPLPMPTPLK